MLAMFEKAVPTAVCFTRALVVAVHQMFASALLTRPHESSLDQGEDVDMFLRKHEKCPPHFPLAATG